MLSPDAVRTSDSPSGVSARGRSALTAVVCVNGGTALMGRGDDGGGAALFSEVVEDPERMCVRRAVSSDEAKVRG